MTEVKTGAAADPVSEMMAVVVRAEGWVHRDLVRHAGDRIAMPKAEADRLTRLGLVGPVPEFHYAVRDTVLLLEKPGQLRTYDRDSTAVLEQPVDADTLMKSGKVLPLQPGQRPPHPLPPSADDERRWREGPRLPCRLRVKDQWGQVGDELLNKRECDVLYKYHFNIVELLGEPSPIGVEYQEGLRVAEEEGRGQYPTYASFARRARRTPPPPGDDQGPLLKCQALRPIRIDGHSREPLEIFSVPEAIAAPAFVDGAIQILPRPVPSPRFEANVEALMRFKSDPTAKHPVY
jgi:hypothetical protein